MTPMFVVCTDCVRDGYVIVLSPKPLARVVRYCICCGRECVEQL
jgi:hypothetical protein